MAKIRFSHNWNNKLNCDVFTTIRKYSESKSEFYRGLVGNKIQIDLNGDIIKEKTLVKVIEKRFSKIPETLVSIDVGIPYNKCKDVFRKFGIEDSTTCLILVFN